MKKKAIALLLTALCLAPISHIAAAETREGVIALEGSEEPIRETLYESPLGFSFWYADERLEAYPGGEGDAEGVVVAALYSDDYMVLSMITEAEAAEYAGDRDQDAAGLSDGPRMQTDLYRELEDGQYRFSTLISENGHYLRAVGLYSREAAEGNAKFFQRVLDSVTFASE